MHEIKAYPPLYSKNIDALIVIRPVIVILQKIHTKKWRIF